MLQCSYSKKNNSTWPASAAAMLLLLGVLLSGGRAGAQSAPYLVKDINTSTTQWSSQPRYLAAIGTDIYFSAIDPFNGTELWKSTPAGTVLVKDIIPGARSSTPTYLTGVNSTLFFVADNGINGQELWKSDGTAAGTVLVKDITPGPFGSLINTLFALNGKLFFVANDGVHGRELWVSDGTDAGTLMVKDINPGIGDGSIGSMTALNNMLYFSARDASGYSIWHSDGTVAGTTRTLSLGASYSYGMAAVNGKLIYIQNGLQANDGITTAALKLNKFDYHNTGLKPNTVAMLNGSLYFISYYNNYSSAQAMHIMLWKTDGTTAGTAIVKDVGAINPSINLSGGFELTCAGGMLYFIGASGSGRRSLWTSDGTAAGTVEVGGSFVDQGNVVLNNLLAVNDKVYFTIDDGVHGVEPWVSDGSATGTRLVKDIYPGLTSGLQTSSNWTTVWVSVGDTVFMAANDGIYGTELWKTDGTAAGTLLVKDCVAGTAGSDPQSMIASGQTLLFSANDAVHGRELWASNGSASGTRLVADIRPGPLDSMPASGILNVPTKSQFTSSLIANAWNLNGTPYFAAADGTNGIGLWKCNAQLTSVSASANSLSFVTDMAAIGKAVFYNNAYTTFTGSKFYRVQDLWKSDGTTPGAVLVKRNQQLSSAYSISTDMRSLMVPMGGKLYFSDLVTFASQVWVSDGTASGTTLLINTMPGATSVDSPTCLNVAGNHLFFIASVSAGVKQLWVSDGTSLKTYPLKATNSSLVKTPGALAVSRNKLFFTMEDQAHGAELWVSDGTDAGTVMVKDIYPGPGGSVPQGLVDVDGVLFFSANDGTSGRELWKSDGTPRGTIMIKDICPGAGSSWPSSGVSAGGLLCFNAYDPAHGNELWISDGTSVGTHLVTDLIPGANGSAPASLCPVGSLLFFSAFTGSGNAQGRELWAWKIQAPPKTGVRDWTLYGKE